jgi:hypothetical protein
MNDLFMGGLLGCKMAQSSLSALKGGGVNFLGGVSVTIFSHAKLMIFFGCDCALSTHLALLFPMEKNCDISLPPHRIESSLGSTLISYGA